jgi:hypothetical protein
VTMITNVFEPLLWPLLLLLLPPPLVPLFEPLPPVPAPLELVGYAPPAGLPGVELGL